MNHPITRIMLILKKATSNFLIRNVATGVAVVFVASFLFFKHKDDQFSKIPENLRYRIVSQNCNPEINNSDIVSLSKSEFNSIVFFAVANCDSDQLFKLMTDGRFNKNLYDSRNGGLLHQAAMNKNYPYNIVDIITLNLNLELRNGRGATPLVVAIENNNTQGVKILRRFGASSEIHYGPYRTISELCDSIGSSMSQTCEMILEN